MRMKMHREDVVRGECNEYCVEMNGIVECPNPGHRVFGDFQSNPDNPLNFTVPTIILRQSSSHPHIATIR